jgi:spermidine/putrescine transport system substrate-binding protein
VKLKNLFIVQLLSKALVVGIYVAVFALFLYLPMLVDFFKPSRVINVCVFTETFCPEAIDQFEKQTGIKVNLTYVEIDEQIYAKFKINEGVGYDVVNISDYMIDILSKQGLLHAIDHNKVQAINQLDMRLMHQIFDRNNEFSLPHKWYTYGLAYDKNFFKKTPDEMSWDFVFKDPQTLYNQGLVPSPYKLCMLDDGRDASFVAAIYLFGRVNNLDIHDFEKIRELLIKQKKWVEAYTVHSSQYFLFTDVTPIALMSSNYMRRILANSDRFEFAIPKEGSMLIIENLAIPKSSNKVDLAYQFINFMLSDHAAQLNSRAFGYNSANKHANDIVNAQYIANPHLIPDDEMHKRLFIPLLPSNMRKMIEDLWLAVGFA